MRVSGAALSLLSITVSIATLDCVDVVPAHGLPGWPAGAFTQPAGAKKVSFRDTHLPWIIGHRGAGEAEASSPNAENTIPSMVDAIANRGAVGVEIDVQMTKDGKPLVIRGPRMNPTTRCSACVTEITLAEAQTCSVLGTSTLVYPPTLAEALAAMVALPVEPLVLITGRPDGEDDCPASTPEANTDPAEILGGLIGDAVTAANANAFVAVAGRETLVLAARNAANGVMTFTNAGSLGTEVKSATMFGLSGVIAESKDLYDAPLGDAAHANVLVEAWDVNTPIDIVSAIAHDVAIVETSRIAAVRDAL